MTNGRLYDFIRFEAKIPGSNSVVGFIRETVIEVLRDLTAIDFYQELHNFGAIVTSVGVGQTSFAFPSGVQHVVPESVMFLPAGDVTKSQQLFESDLWNFLNAGSPRRFRTSSNALLIYPYSDVAIGDVIKFDYYQYLQTGDLVDTDEFPIPKLEGVVKKAVIARLIRWTGKDGSAMEADANQSLGRSKGSGDT